MKTVGYFIFESLRNPESLMKINKKLKRMQTESYPENLISVRLGRAQIWLNKSLQSVCHILDQWLLKPHASLSGPTQS